MSGGLIAIVLMLCLWLREKLTPAIPPENFENSELYYQDIVNGVPFEQCQENIKNGRYKAPKYRKEPHEESKNEKSRE